MNSIRLEGVRVHNLKNVSLLLPLRRLIVVSGVSGSGKSSLAFDTLFAEGQRRYIGTLAPAARQFLPLLDRPEAERIENIPPAVAVRQTAGRPGARETVASATEIYDALRFLFAQLGEVVCRKCGRTIQAAGPEAVVQWLKQLSEQTRFMICCSVNEEQTFQDTSKLEWSDERLQELRQAGFRRAVLIVEEEDRQRAETVELEHCSAELLQQARVVDLWIVVDRVVAGRVDESRLLDSLEQAFFFGNERCVLVWEATKDDQTQAEQLEADGLLALRDRTWLWRVFSQKYECRRCRLSYEEPGHQLFSHDSPLGACPHCHGFGRVPTISFEHLVPDPNKSLREGAIVPWTTPAYRHELDELLALAPDYGIPVDVPFSQLKPEHLKLILNGVPERRFGGLRGFFNWLERHRYRLGVRVFLNRWRAYKTCPACGGSRLRPEALAVRLPRLEGTVEKAGRRPSTRFNAAQTTELDGRNIAEVCQLTVEQAADALTSFENRLPAEQAERVKHFLEAIARRLEVLQEVGLGYVTLDRQLRTLSDGEAKRVMLTTCLGTGLVNTLFVLDEPSCGLHPRDNERILTAVKRLRDTGNTVVVVEHEPEFIEAADEVVDIGPRAGQEGGEIVFQGPPNALRECERSLTGAYLSGRAKIDVPLRRRQPTAWLELKNVRHHNLQGIDVAFPLGVLCAVTGVSGSGKSSLVEQTLFPAVCRALQQPLAPGQWGKYDTLLGAEHLAAVVLVDTSPVGKTPRSNPVTYIKAFDEIRQAFAQTREAKMRNFTAKHFSFNSADGGRCLKCKGAGVVEIDMHFLADISMTCPECHGKRYRPEILEIKYRGLNIAEVLDMTVREAFSFFRNQPRTQRRLSFLMRVGLDYLRLGQPATTLSGGESQRLKLAAFLAQQSQPRTLFLVNEPTTGLHLHDVAKLLECLSIGRSRTLGHCD